MSLTLSDLERITGAKRRSLRLWADAGVIEAEPDSMLAGRGVHREFTRDEAIIACAVKAFADLPMSIGGLKSVALALRTMLSKYPDERSKIERAISGEAYAYLVSERWADSSWRISIFTALDLPTANAELAKEFIRALARSVSNLEKRNAIAGIILLNTYTRGLSK